jgi:hypothetical protein
MRTGPEVRNKLVKPGIYEIQSEMTGLYLNSVEDAIYNRWCDDTLTLDKRPSRRGKVSGFIAIQKTSSDEYSICIVGDHPGW